MTRGDIKTVSFMRSLCMGRIEGNILFPFPKVDSEQGETLREVAGSVDTLLSSYSSQFRGWDRQGELPEEFIEELRNFGLFGLVIPEEFGGMGFGSAAYSRTLQQLAKHDASVAVTVGAHSSIGLRALLLFGSDEQKERYFPKLATGEMIAAFCLTEPSAGSDAGAIRTSAVRDGDDWVINGSKLWITNGGIADFFTVFARTSDEGRGKISAFIVTRELPGVSIGPHEDKMGIRASSTTSVHFDGVRVPHANLIGEENKGFKIAMSVLNSGRTGLGGGSIGAMKGLIELATAQAKERKQFGKSIAEFGLIKQKVGSMLVDCYATEAVVTMVASLTDQGYEDYAVEAAISKVFASEALWRTADEALQIAAGNGYMCEFPYERVLRDARINRIFEGTNDILRLFIALNAMGDVGGQLKELARSLQGVFNDPIKGFGLLSEYALRRAQLATGLGGDKGTLEQASPHLREATVIFEQQTKELALAVDRILRKHGKDIIGKQFASARLANIMIDLFVLGCVISRVDSSVRELGPEKAKHELEILRVFSHQARGRIQDSLAGIDNNQDEATKSLADHAFEQEKFPWDTV